MILCLFPKTRNVEEMAVALKVHEAGYVSTIDSCLQAAAFFPVMPAVDEKNLDGKDPLEPPSTKQNTALRSVALSGMPMHIYPYPPALLPTQQPMKSKRRQVKNACTNCQKACKKCDDARPCLRCVKYGISEECVDSQRKERQKGIKRGPYKKRDGKGVSLSHRRLLSPS